MNTPPQGQQIKTTTNPNTEVLLEIIVLFFVPLRQKL